MVCIPTELADIIRNHSRSPEVIWGCSLRELLHIQKYVFVLLPDGNILQISTLLGDVAMLRLQIKLGQVPTRDMLLHACVHGHVEISKILFEEVSLDEELLRDIFQDACTRNRIEILEIWVKQIGKITLATDPVLVNIRDILYHVCVDGYTDVVKVIAMAQPSLLDKNCFIYACMFGHIDLVRMFLFGVPIKTKNGRGFIFVPPDQIHDGGIKGFGYACENGHTDIVKILLEVLPPEDIREDAYQAFRLACENGHTDIVKILLELLPDIPEDINQIFCVACENGHIGIVKVLLEVLPEDIHDISQAFFLACKNGYTEIVKILLQRIGHNPDACSSALYEAVEGGHKELVEILTKAIAELYVVRTQFSS